MTTFSRDLSYEQSIQRLQAKLTAQLESLNDVSSWTDLDRFAIERVLQLLIESFIGFARYYIQVAFQQKAFKTRDAIDELFNKKALTAGEHATSLKIIAFRNVIVHDYLDIDPNIVQSVVKKADYKLLITITQRLQSKLCAEK